MQTAQKKERNCPPLHSSVASSSQPRSFARSHIVIARQPFVPQRLRGRTPEKKKTKNADIDIEKQKDI
jgi:hypothetical protein